MVAHERPKHAWLRALGPDDLPASIELADGPYRHLRTFKHDFYAATGLYEGPGGRLILKLSRTAPLCGISMRWLGRLLAGREAATHERLAGLERVPRLIGRWDATGLVREFVAGHPLQPDERLPDGFFDELGGILDEIHRRCVAYNDLHKRENVIVDPQGLPRLVDFQLAWHWPEAGEARRGLKRWLPRRLGAYIFGQMAAADRYHLLKLRRRHGPDELTAEEFAARHRGGFYIRLQRQLRRPWKLFRRLALKRLIGQSRSPKQEGPEFLEPLGGEGPPPSRGP